VALCIAVGSEDTKLYPAGIAFAERWDGKAWSSQTLPEPVH
jgi:hypothetical protein